MSVFRGTLTMSGCPFVFKAVIFFTKETDKAVVKK